MSLYVTEVASRLGALHQDFLADGEAFDAHLLRTMAMSSNLLASHGEPIVNLLWDSSTDAGDETQGSLTGFGWPFWVRVVGGPLVVPKKPGLTRAAVDVIAKISDSDRCRLLVWPGLGEPDPHIDIADARVIDMLGDGDNDFDIYSTTGVRVAASPTEHLSFYVRGDLTSDLAAAGTNTGTITQQHWDRLVDSGAAFDAGLATGGHVIVFEDAAQTVDLMMPRVITARVSATELTFFPAIDNVGMLLASIGATYSIYQLPRWRICNLACWTEDLDT